MSPSLQVANYLLPEDISLKDIDHGQDLETAIFEVHKKIDELFSTDYARGYTSEGRAHKKQKEAEFTNCYIPFGPGGPKIGKLAQMGEDAALVEEVKSLEGIALEKGVDMKPSSPLQKDLPLKKWMPTVEENASFEKFKKAKEYLKPYRNQFFTSETEARKILHQAGIEMPPSPKGIPENFKIKLSKEPGIMYIDPTNNHISIRLMPGKPHSPNPTQREPYIIYQRHGNTLDKFGNIVEKKSIEAHIPLNEFTYFGD